jgi:histidinol-phosphate aminotransferase
MAIDDIACSFKDSVQGLDYYWPGTSIREACERFGLRPDQVIKMASNECAYGPSPKALEAAQGALLRSAIYPSSKYDYSELTRAFAQYAGVDASMIAPAPGSETMCRYLCEVFLGHGAEAIVSAQSYDGHQIASCIAGAEVRAVPPAGYRYDVDGIIAAVTDRTRIIWVCNPDNPSGTALSKAEVRRLVESVPPTVAVVFDEAYHEFVDDADYGDGLDLLLEGRRNVVVLRTLSKAFGLAALRLGYAIADPELCTVVDNIREPFYIAGPSCAAGVAAVTEDRDWSRRVCGEIVAERRRVEIALSDLGLGVVPSQANFVLVDTHRDGTELYEGLMRHGIIVRLGSIWGWNTHVRITIGMPEHNDRMLAAVAAELQPAG